MVMINKIKKKNIKNDIIKSGDLRIHNHYTGFS